MNTTCMPIGRIMQKEWHEENPSDPTPSCSPPDKRGHTSHKVDRQGRAWVGLPGRARPGGD